MAKCSWCGKYCNDSFLASNLNVFVDGAGGLAKSFCSTKCKKEYEASKGGSGGSSGGKSAAELAEERRIAREEEAAEKARLKEIEMKEFSEDDAEYKKELSGFLYDFAESPKLNEKPRKYYQAYLKRVNKEVSVLKSSNLEKFELYNPQIQEAIKSAKSIWKKRNITGIIVAVVIFLVCVIGCAASGEAEMVGVGLFCGILFGLVAWLFITKRIGIGVKI